MGRIKPMDEGYKERMVFVHGVTSGRYGEKMLRGLACEALDLGKIASLSDAQLANIPGIGEKGVRRVREMLKSCGRS
jgi:ERCC4-type nuclease